VILLLKCLHFFLGIEYNTSKFFPAWWQAEFVNAILAYMSQAATADPYRCLIQSNQICIIFLTRLFETHPDVKEVFMPFNGIKVEELQHSKQLRAHALRYITVIQTYLILIYDGLQVQIILSALLLYGALHSFLLCCQRRGLDNEYLDVTVSVSKVYKVANYNTTWK